MLNIIVDMDILCFRAALVGETTTDWGDGAITTELNVSRSIQYFNDALKSIVSTVTQRYPGEYCAHYCFSDSHCFRKDVYPEYKANRKQPKPALYQDLRNYAEAQWSCQCWPSLEADDVMGILATSLPNSVVCSIDKDMATIPGITFYNWDKQTFIETTVESARYAHYFQCLIGDTVDNYPGCKGIGKVKATAALDKECSWEAVVKVYASKGQTEEDALTQARVAKILTKEWWDGAKPILWLPMPSDATKCNREVQ